MGRLTLMTEIAPVDYADIHCKLPDLVPFNVDALGDMGAAYLICCRGFEERSFAVQEDFHTSTLSGLLVVSYPTNEEDNVSSEQAFSRLQANSNLSVLYERGTFLTQVREAVRAWENDSTTTVIVDLSGMASYIVPRVLWAVWQELPKARCAIYYAEANTYHPTQDEWNEFFSGVEDPDDNLSIAEQYEQTYFQTRGVGTIAECEVFPGHNAGPLATQLVAVPSFSFQRVKSMVAHVESQYNADCERVRWFLGQPPDKAKNGWRFDALAKLYNVKTRGVAVSTRDYRDVIQKLDAVWEEQFTERHLVIADLGSKLQHVGIFLFLQMHPECGLVLSEPEHYIADRYSLGVGPKWWLDLGEIHSLQTLLASRGSLQFRW